MGHSKKGKVINKYELEKSEKAFVQASSFVSFAFWRLETQQTLSISYLFTDFFHLESCCGTPSRNFSCFALQSFCKRVFFLSVKETHKRKTFQEIILRKQGTFFWRGQKIVTARKD